MKKSGRIVDVYMSNVETVTALDTAEIIDRCSAEIKSARFVSPKLGKAGFWGI